MSTDTRYSKEQVREAMGKADELAELLERNVGEQITALEDDGPTIRILIAALSQLLEDYERIEWLESKLADVRFEVEEDEDGGAVDGPWWIEWDAKPLHARYEVGRATLRLAIDAARTQEPTP